MMTFHFEAAHNNSPQTDAPKAGRPLPHSSGWLARALSISLVQVLITVTVGFYWHRCWSGSSLLTLNSLEMVIH
jgi:hypothetical protein